VGTRTVLDTLAKRKIPTPRRESNLRTSIVLPVAQLYTTEHIEAESENDVWFFYFQKKIPTQFVPEGHHERCIPRGSGTSSTFLSLGLEEKIGAKCSTTEGAFGQFLHNLFGAAPLFY
jgi:hypothetical protein